MKIIITAVLAAFLLAGCADKAENVSVEPILVVGNSLKDLKINDQFGEEHGIKMETKKVIFAFTEDPAHTVNDFLVTKPSTYLSDNNVQFIADVSGAPDIIRSMFIMPGLKDFKHTVLIFEDEAVAAPFKSGSKEDSIVLVGLDNAKIVSVENVVVTAETLPDIIEM